MQHQIYYHDTDSGGVVYYANYLKYMEEARTEYFEQRGFSIIAFVAQGFSFAVRSCHILYKAPARYGDIISADARVDKVSAAQIFFQQSVINQRSGQVLVEADIILVFLNKDFKPQQIPKKCRESL